MTGSRPPVDGVTQVFVPVTLKQLHRVLIFSIAAVGTAMAIVFLLINIIFRNRKYVILPVCINEVPNHVYYCSKWNSIPY